MEKTAIKTTWAIDPAHSEVQFKVKHLVISTVTGQFKNFSGKLETESDTFENAKVTFEADIKSISTNNEDRDNHLKSSDFFEAESYPKLTFVSKSFNKLGGGEFKLIGDLTIKGTSKEVVLNVEHGGVMVDPYGNTKAGFEITGEINRKDFGLTWGAITEAGGVVVSDEVKLLMNIQLVKK